MSLDFSKSFDDSDRWDSCESYHPSNDVKKFNIMQYNKKFLFGMHDYTLTLLIIYYNWPTTFDNIL